MAKGEVLGLGGQNDVLNAQCPHCDKKIVFLGREMRAKVSALILKGASAQEPDSKADEHDLQRAKESLAEVQELVYKRKLLAREAKGLTQLRADARGWVRLKKLSEELHQLVRRASVKARIKEIEDAHLPAVRKRKSGADGTRQRRGNRKVSTYGSGSHVHAQAATAVGR